jgi:hypothetical protein
MPVRSLTRSQFVFIFFIIAMTISSRECCARQQLSGYPQRFQTTQVSEASADFFDASDNSDSDQLRYRVESDPFPLDANHFGAQADVPPPTSGRPRGIPIGLRTEWLSDPDAGLSTSGVSIKAPLLRGFGSPPPIVKIGFDYTNLFAADQFGLPDDLYTYSIGISSVRRINDRWAVRTMLGTAFSTDHDNTSSDAWQFRGGAFGIYERSPQWKWTFGAIALGRRDLPVLPAFGAIWQPTQRHRFDLTLPTIKANYLLSDDGQRQRWTYLGIGLNGNTWGVERTDGVDDQLSYGDWRVLFGWQSRPTPEPGKSFSIGRTNSLSIGYAFSRDLEFQNETLEVPLASTFLIQLSTSY